MLKTTGSPIRPIFRELGFDYGKVVGFGISGSDDSNGKLL